MIYCGLQIGYVEGRKCINVLYIGGVLTRHSYNGNVVWYLPLLLSHKGIQCNAVLIKKGLILHLKRPRMRSFFVVISLLHLKAVEQAVELLWFETSWGSCDVSALGCVLFMERTNISKWVESWDRWFIFTLHLFVCVCITPNKLGHKIIYLVKIIHKRNGPFDTACRVWLDRTITFDTTVNLIRLES